MDSRAGLGRRLALGGGILTMGALWAAGCSDSFSNCKETRTCKPAPTSAGQGGDGGTESSSGGSDVGPQGGGSDDAAGSSSGGSNTGSAGESNPHEAGAGGQPQVDDVAPTIVSVSPDNGEAGLPSDTTIEITFSEAMDKVATQAAFQSANLGAVTFDWPSDDVLVVTPNVALEYAKGTSLALSAKVYNFSVTTAARDEAGNALKNAKLSEFATLRQITAIVPEQSAHYCWNDGEGGLVSLNFEPGEGVQIGDAPISSHPVNYRRALLVFDISSLPNGIESFVSAELSTSFCCPQGDPGLLGSISVDHIFVAPIDESFFEKTPLDTPGVLANSAGAGKKTISVKDALASDYALRIPQSNEAQFRVQFAIDRNENITTDEITLDNVSGQTEPTRILATFLVE